MASIFMFPLILYNKTCLQSKLTIVYVKIVARYVHFLFKTFELIMTRFDLVSSGDKKNVRGMS